MAPRTSLALFLSLNLLLVTYTSATTPSVGTCPRDALKIGACVDVLNLVDLTLGSPSVGPCCSLIDGLADLEAAVCLCTSLKASVLGLIKLNLLTNLNILLNVCGRQAQRNFQCA